MTEPAFAPQVLVLHPRFCEGATMALRACHCCFGGAKETLLGDVPREVTLERRGRGAIGLDADPDSGHGLKHVTRERGTAVPLVEVA